MLLRQYLSLERALADWSDHRVRRSEVYSRVACAFCDILSGSLSPPFRPLTNTPRPLLCGSVPADLPGEGAVGRDWEEGDEKDEGDEEEEDDDLGEAGREAREAWGEDAMVSGDPASIERAFGHAVDFVVDAGVLEVRRGRTLLRFRTRVPHRSVLSPSYATNAFIVAAVACAPKPFGSTSGKRAAET